MATIACPNCGALVEPSAKFCRQCGRPSTLSEATTRNLDVPEPAVQAATQPVYPIPTAPSYAPPPTFMAPQPAQQTKGFESTGLKRIIIVLASLVGLLVVALGLLVAITFFLRPSGAPARSGGISVPRVPEPPVPPLPPDVPPPPLPPVDSSAASSDSGLVYPGATVLMNLTTDEGTVLQLHSNDSTDKVIAWYVAKLKPKNRFNVPGGIATLVAGDVKVVITPDARGSNIVVKQGGN